MSADTTALRRDGHATDLALERLHAGERRGHGHVSK